MPATGRLIMLPLRTHAKVPNVPDDVFTMPELVLPESGSFVPGSTVPVGTAPAPTTTLPPPPQVIHDAPPVAYEFLTKEIGSRLPWAPQNTPNPSNALKTSITFHYEGADAIPAMDDEQTVDYLIQVANEHIARDWGGGFGGSGIMYHECISQQGNFLIMRPYTDITWHSNTAEGNAHSRAILVLCSIATPPNAIQLAAVRRRTQDFGASVRGHRDWTPTNCPGDQVYSVVSDLKRTYP